MALAIVGELFDRETAKLVQLALEYAPEPPFTAGRPETAPPEVLVKARERGRSARAAREAVVQRVRARNAASA